MRIHLSWALKANNQYPGSFATNVRHPYGKENIFIFSQVIAPEDSKDMKSKWVTWKPRDEERARNSRAGLGTWKSKAMVSKPGKNGPSKEEIMKQNRVGVGWSTGTGLCLLDIADFIPKWSCLPYFFRDSFIVNPIGCISLYTRSTPRWPISHQEHGKFCPEAFGKVEQT